VRSLCRGPAGRALSHWWHLPTLASLGVIVVILAVAIAASMGKAVVREG
jgi:hypothetical protein